MKKLNTEKKEIKNLDKILSEYRSEGDLILIVRTMRNVDIDLSQEIDQFIKSMRDKIKDILTPKKEEDVQKSE